MFAAAHECMFYDTQIARCSNVFFRGYVVHDREILRGLANLRLLRQAGESMQFLQAMKWLRTSLLRLSEVVEPLRGLVEEHLGGQVRRTKRVASNRTLEESGWMPRCAQAWLEGQDLVANAVVLSFCRFYRIEAHVTDVVKKCLHCLNLEAGEMVPRPPGETVPGTRLGEVMHFDDLYLGKCIPLGDSGLGEDDWYKHILVTMDDSSKFVWLEPTES